MKRFYLALIVFFLCLPVATTLFAGDAEAGATGGSLTGTLASFGLSMGLSWVTGFIQKRTQKKQGWRNAIPATNAAGMGGIVAAVTQDPIYTASAAVGALAASGVQKLLKRAIWGRW